MFNRKEIELLQKAVYEAYRTTKKRKDFVEDTLDDDEEDGLYNIYCDEMNNYLEIKLKLDKLLDKAE